jgi:hypothetical protein
MTEGRTNRVSVNCKIEHETERAWLIDEGTKKVWIPKSQGEVYRLSDGTVDLFVEEWIAKEKGII